MLAVLGLAAGVAQARGGGGGGFDPGGGGGGGGGGGDGDWTILIDIIWLLIEAPEIGVPVLAVVVVVMIVGGRKGKRAHQGRVIRRGVRALAGQRRAQAVAALLERDPAFDEAAFLARVRVAFRKVQEGWCAHDLAPMRAFVSDGVYERFSLQVREQQDLGYRDQMDGLRVRGAALAQVAVEGPFDVVTVGIEASAKDYRVRALDGKRIRGTDLPEEFVEYWSFLRRRGRRTKPGAPGLIEGQCPNCGAAVEMNQAAACAYCKAALRSGEFDWVLAEITQAVDWQDTPPAEVPGLEAFVARDPAFCVQHLEDRASVAFWRRAEADRVGDPAPLRRIAAPEFLEAYAKSLAHEAAQPERGWFGECAVGSVRVLGVGAADGRDRAAVQVRWQGTWFARAQGGEPQRGVKGPVRAAMLVFSRRMGVLSDADTSVSSAHCPNCGAPEEGGLTDACEHCGQVLNDGSRGWALVASVPAASSEAQAVLAGLAAAGPVAGDGSARPEPRDRRALLAWLARVAAADGVVSPKEREALDRLGAKAGLRREGVDGVVADALSEQPGDLPRPARAEEARAWLDEMAEVALADGRVDDGEGRLLQRLGASCGIPRNEVARTVNETRLRLFRASREALRSARARS